MQIVIDIDEEDYEYVKEVVQQEEYVLSKFYYPIANGTPLPKGHGRLIDASQLFMVTECRPDGTEFTYVPYTSIENAEAVIKADKEVEDEGSGV